ncbi:DUF2919 domain-containing protein [Pantoea sp. BAV 3049]|uniref:DUF2919 domain-containing protein n=1 Tax=Pantoea sp. BAV 3049 TaxID=2654188 RepID=UPI00131C3745|nr:DUF2919 domain-containing protein [Pantoea sp. BAV 3049]
MNLTYSPDDYDARGQLKLPVGFWIILLLQARTWVLFVMAGASKQQGATLLALFYPDTRAFWIGLGLGIPATLGLLLTGYRQRLPRLWQAWHWVLCLALVAIVLLQAIMIWLGDDQYSPLVILVTVFDLLGLAYLTMSRRLKDCFSPDLNGE